MCVLLQKKSFPSLFPIWFFSCRPSPNASPSRLIPFCLKFLQQQSEQDSVPRDDAQSLVRRAVAHFLNFRGNNFKLTCAGCGRRLAPAQASYHAVLPVVPGCQTPAACLTSSRPGRQWRQPPEQGQKTDMQQRDCRCHMHKCGRLLWPPHLHRSAPA